MIYKYRYGIVWGLFLSYFPPMFGWICRCETHRYGVNNMAVAACWRHRVCTSAPPPHQDQMWDGWLAHLSSGRESRCGCGSCTACGLACTSSGWSLAGWLPPRLWSAVQGRPKEHMRRGNHYSWRSLTSAGACWTSTAIKRSHYPLRAKLLCSALAKQEHQCKEKRADWQCLVLCI